MRCWTQVARLVAILATLGAVHAAEERRAEPRPAAATREHSAPEHGPENAAKGHHDGHVVPILIGLVVILLAATLGGELAERIGQPSVLGELLAGVVLGNLALLGFEGFEFVASNEGIAILAELGVILLLFKVGLESSVRDMLSVGPSSLSASPLASSPTSGGSRPGSRR